MEKTIDRTEDPTDEGTTSAAPPADNVIVNELRAENIELRNEIRLGAARETLLTEMKRIGALSPNLMFETIKGKLQFDDDGRPVNAAALVADMKRAFPEQFGGGAAAGLIDGGAGTGTAANFLTADALAKMTPAEIAGLDWNDVRRVLNS